MNPDNTARGRKLALIGAWLQLGPLLGGLATAIGMLQAFSVLQEANIADPRELSGKIGAVLIFTIAGLLLGLIGLVLIGICLATSNYRAPFIFWILVIQGVLYLVGFPLGTIVGVALLIYCFSHRAEFRRVRPESQRKPA